MTPSLVEHEVEGLGYAETAGAREELMNLLLAVSNQEGQPIEKKNERRRVISQDELAC